VTCTVRDLLTIEAARFVGQHLAVADMLQRNRIGALGMRPPSANGLTVGKRTTREGFRRYHREDMRRRRAAAKGKSLDA